MNLEKAKNCILSLCLYLVWCDEDACQGSGFLLWVKAQPVMVIQHGGDSIKSEAIAVVFFKPPSQIGQQVSSEMHQLYQIATTNATSIHLASYPWLSAIDMECYGATWSYMELHGATWSHGPFN